MASRDLSVFFGITQTNIQIHSCLTSICSEAVQSSESDVNVRNDEGATLLIVASYYMYVYLNCLRAGVIETNEAQSRTFW